MDEKDTDTPQEPVTTSAWENGALTPPIVTPIRPREDELEDLGGDAA